MKMTRKLTLPHTSCIRAVLVVLWALICTSAFAQSRISVAREEHDPNEATCRSYPQKDANNKDCALVIVHNIMPEGYRFSAAPALAKVENHTNKDGEKVIWVYMSPNSKKLSIKHTDTSIIPLDYVLENAPLESKETYHLYLGDIAPSGGKQYLTFELTPADAILEVEDNPLGAPGIYTPWVLENGKASKIVNFGDYRYRAKANDYHSTAGTVRVNNRNEPVVEKVQLAPAFGYFTIPTSNDMQGAQIFVDGRPVGTTNINRLQLSAGAHEVSVTKKLFKPYQTSVNVEEGKELVLRPVLVSNVSPITINCSDDGASLYVREMNSDRFLGNGTWQGPLEPGNYVIVAKRSGHKDVLKSITVVEGVGNVFSIGSGQAMYGMINVTSTPSGATIYLDGKDMGVTPKILNNVLAEQHTIKISKPGYDDYNAKITLIDGQTAEVNAVLSNVCNVTITGNAYRYTVKAGGKKVAETTSSSANRYDATTKLRVARGTRISVDAEGKWRHGNVSKSYLINTNRTITINCPRYLLHRKEFYVDLGLAYSGYIGGTVSLGFNANHFNMQLDCDLPFTNNSYEYCEVYPSYYGDYLNTYYEYSEINLGLGLRFGYSARIGSRFRLTPQVGYKSYIGDYAGTGSVILALRANLYTSYHCSIYASPEYQIAVGDKDPAQYLYGAANNWCDGFACHLGVSFNF